MDNKLRGGTTIQTALVHTVKPWCRRAFNRLFATVYMFAILALLYHHAETLFNSKTPVSFFVTLILLIADLVLTFMWSTSQALAMCPIYRKEFPENLERVMERSDFPALDVFIPTADPYKEPPICVVNTALSVMAFDYPTEKLSVYVSDDGGSALTLFAFMEAAKFAAHWLPFCRKNKIVQRCPKAYFQSCHSSSSEAKEMKLMYESMKERVEHVVGRGKVDAEYITSDRERQVLNKWNDKFTRQNHPTVIQVLVENGKDEDASGHSMPNLVYVSREKSKTSNHHFKAGALNVLLRVSSTMTNAPIILVLDCDVYSNDPTTPLRILCYYSDPKTRSKYGFVQFPQHFHGINKNDIYTGEFRSFYHIQPKGFDGLIGSEFLGSNGFFLRRAFFGSPSNLISPEIPELHPNHIVNKPIQSSEILELAHHVAGCNYEKQTNWGYKMGFRYESLVEDIFTGLQLHCQGWRSIFCNPDRPAFLGDAPISLINMMLQQKRWSVGFLEVGFSKYSPLIFGSKAMGLLAGLGYSYTFFAIWGIPITIYAFLPQLALLNKLSIFPKVSEPWFLLYGFLFLGAYAKDCFEFVSSGGTFQKWWNDQRAWYIKGVSSYLFGFTEFLLKSMGISNVSFFVTSKVIDDEQSKRYNQGMFEFGEHSSLFVPLTMAALINLTSFCSGLVEIFRGSNLEGLVVQMFIAGFAIVNCVPIYEAMILRDDRGKLSAKTALLSIFLALSLCTTASFIFR